MLVTDTVKVKPLVLFRAVHKTADIYSIQIERDGRLLNKWVLWCDLAAKRVCAVDQLSMAWGASKSQAEDGAVELTNLYAYGEIE